MARNSHAVQSAERPRWSFQLRMVHQLPSTLRNKAYSRPKCRLAVVAEPSQGERRVLALLRISGRHRLRLRDGDGRGRSLLQLSYDEGSWQHFASSFEVRYIEEQIRRRREPSSIAEAVTALPATGTSHPAQRQVAANALCASSGKAAAFVH